MRIPADPRAAQRIGRGKIIYESFLHYKIPGVRNWSPEINQLEDRHTAITWLSKICALCICFSDGGLC